MYKIRNVKTGKWLEQTEFPETERIVRWSSWRNKATKFLFSVDAVNECINYRLYDCEIVGRRQ